VIACRPGSVVQRLARRRGVQTIPVLLRGPADVSSARTLRGYLARHGVPVIHAHDRVSQHLSVTATFGGAAARVTSLRGGDLPRRGLAGLLGRVGVDRWITVSERLAGDLAGRSVDPSRVSVMPRGVAVGTCDHPRGPRRGAALAPLGLASHAGPVIVTAACLSRHEGLSQLVTAGAHLRALRDDAVILIVGAGEQRHFLEAQVAREALSDTVRLPGFVDDIDPLLAAADVYVAPAAGNGFHSAIVRAMAAGLPVVATDTGDARDLIAHERSGVLVPPNDPHAIAQAVHRVLSHPEWAAGLANSGRRLVGERHSVAAMVHGHRKLYAQLVDGHR